MSCLAIITARGGSKRIPRKNIKVFCGKPIIAYSIEATLKSGIFDEVMVSTDDEEIASIAKKYGASVPFLRSEATANDFATTVDVLKEVICEYKARGKEFDSVCCIYPTAPFIKGEKLQAAYELFQKEKADSLVPVVEFSFPPLRGFSITDGKVKYKWPEFEKARSQDLDKIYHDAGQFYICSVKSLIDNNTLVSPNTVPFILDELEVQDIDTEMDWKLAELKYKLLEAEK
ncbi:N-acylneuraminate cytidylyltransferase [Pseudobutyrivibrio sp. 49]|uniref:pseudaminic acid cytidylyltransferase n=1 Tax=Pseudobutyrivibrio sp. 49 TaxID=1855344 RepID=UPI00088A1393|nr:pseudaminic acid cytidylyltransferase [Pseudobutyrivibrio sp. 49]SDH61333.1 N-acylneuraminate cytidylyltransferase [Pseudobutyrivibrio sp. 49]